ncbi:hypothetical protein [Listeria seeligeri]|uniref:hypothetical protein n=1 Tax=Listeria seeligeri TaxID=1640 RepID=UPI003A599635
MRKTFGYHLYKNGVGLELIQLFLNHSSPRISLRYISIEQGDKDHRRQVIWDCNSKKPEQKFRLG